MPNVVGVWNPELRHESVRIVIAKQLDRVRVPQVAYTEHIATFPGFGMALQDHGLLENGPQPAWSDDGQTALLLDGEIYNGAELERQFCCDLPQRNLSSPELCLHLILRHGPEAARFFNGMFCMVVYERKAGRVTIISDRHGARSLFYTHRRGTVLFGTELKALAATDSVSRSIDEIGTFELFCYGSHFMDRTWMEGYRRMPPASILTVDEGGLKMRHYWSYRYREDGHTLDQPTYATVFGLLLDRAVERCMRGRRSIGIFLSGGFDSRSVAACIRRHGRPLPAFTFGLPESRDVRFAKMLADRLGFEHHVLTLQNPYLYSSCHAIVWRTEGMLPFANTTSIHWHAAIKERADIILTGFLGEFSGSHTWPQLLLARSRPAAINAIYRRFMASRLSIPQRVFQPTFFARIFPAVRDLFYKSFETVENELPMNIADSWNFLHVQPRGTFHSPSIDRHKFEMRAPHIDSELVDFLLTIPPYERLEQRIYKKMIAHSFPVIRDVPCTNSARPIEPNFIKEYALMVGRYVGRKTATPFQRLFGKQEALGREFRNLGDDFRAEPELVNQILRPLMRTGIFPDSVFNHAGIEQLIREQYEQHINHAQALGLLLSWGLAVKYFLHDDLSDVPLDIYAPEVTMTGRMAQQA